MDSELFNVGGYARITYGMTPNFLNHVDLATGVCLGTGSVGSVIVEGKVGYELESFYHNQEKPWAGNWNSREKVSFSLWKPPFRVGFSTPPIRG